MSKSEAKGEESQMLRKNDTQIGDGIEKVPLRSTRYFKLHNYWYFATREGATLGPFDTREQAAQTIEDYIGFVEQAPVSAIGMLHRDNRIGMH